MEMRRQTRLKEVESSKHYAQLIQLMRRGLWKSLGQLNDHFELELRGAWELPCSSHTPPDGAGEEAYFGFPDGNQTSPSKTRFCQNKTRIRMTFCSRLYWSKWRISIDVEGGCKCSNSKL
jgi:hypothetical protein